MKSLTRSHTWTRLPNGQYRLTWERKSSTGWNPMARTSTHDNARQWANLHGVPFYGAELRVSEKALAEKIARTI